MPRRAAPGHRDVLEAALTPAERALLDRWCARFRVPRAGWHAHPLFRAMVLAAVTNLADEIREGSAVSRDAALLTACARAGLSHDTVRSALYRAETERVLLYADGPSPRDDRDSTRTPTRRTA
jgi:hypothetical protein